MVEQATTTFNIKSSIALNDFNCWDNWFVETPKGVHRYGLYAPKKLPLGESHHTSAQIFHVGEKYKSPTRIRFYDSSNREIKFDSIKYTMWSGSALHHKEKIYLFMTVTDKKTLEQSIWMAESKDGRNFYKLKEILHPTRNNIESLGYHSGDADGIIPAFRDSYAFKDGMNLHLLIAAKSYYKNCPKDVIPSIAHATASVKNPYRWTMQRSFMQFPDLIGTQIELPSIVKMGKYNLLSAYHSPDPADPDPENAMPNGSTQFLCFSRNGQGGWVLANVCTPNNVEAIHLNSINSRLCGTGFNFDREAKEFQSSPLFGLN